MMYTKKELYLQVGCQLLLSQSQIYMFFSFILLVLSPSERIETRFFLFLNMNMLYREKRMKERKNQNWKSITIPYPTTHFIYLDSQQQTIKSLPGRLPTNELTQQLGTSYWIRPSSGKQPHVPSYFDFRVHPYARNNVFMINDLQDNPKPYGLDSIELYILSARQSVYPPSYHTISCSITGFAGQDIYTAV